jgi:hypothetical protein
MANAINVVRADNKAADRNRLSSVLRIFKGLFNPIAHNRSNLTGYRKMYHDVDTCGDCGHCRRPNKRCVMTVPGLPGGYAQRRRKYRSASRNERAGYQRPNQTSYSPRPRSGEVLNWLSVVSTRGSKLVLCIVFMLIVLGYELLPSAARIIANIG